MPICAGRHGVCFYRQASHWSGFPSVTKTTMCNRSLSSLYLSHREEWVTPGAVLDGNNSLHLPRRAVERKGGGVQRSSAVSDGCNNC